MTDMWWRVKTLATVELERTVQTRTVWGVAAAMIAVVVLVAVGATHQAAAAPAAVDAATAAAVASQQTSATLGSIAALRVFVVLLGVLVVTTEYSHGDIVWRYLAEPSRAVLMTAKAVAVAAVGAVLGLVALQVGILVIGLHAGGAEGLGLTSTTAAQSVAGSVLGGALAGVMGVGIGAAVRNQTVAVIGTLVAFLVVEPLMTALVPSIGAYLPNGAASAAVAGDATTFTWAVGLTLTAAYAAIAGLAGGLLCTRNDV